MDKYKNKYRNASARAQWWDYGWNGAYFLTICTQNRTHHFGEVIGGNMVLSKMGVIADILWHEIPNHAQHVELGSYIVMPKHIHGILILDKPVVVVGTLHATSLQQQQQPSSPQPQPQSKNETMAAISPKSNTVSTIVRSYKSAVTKHANRLGLENGWQSRFHDHIIRNDAKYQRISDYIVNNPAQWHVDKFFAE
jgi:REP element-mobilizing transposase RayT